MTICITEGIMTTQNPQFEEGSLEEKIVQGIFKHVSYGMKDATWDVYRNFGIVLQGQLNITYQMEVITMLADYIREQEARGKYMLETLEYLPRYIETGLN